MTRRNLLLIFLSRPFNLSHSKNLRPARQSSTPMERGTIRIGYRKRKFHGFRIGRRLASIFRWATWRQRRTCNPIRIFLDAARRRLGCGFGYERVGRQELEEKRIAYVPKGHLAVYVVGGAGGEKRRVVVPVVYFNHPLFGDLLREAERVYGYNHDGGIITLQCGITELARVHDRIAAGDQDSPRQHRNPFCCWTASKRRLLV